MNRFKNIIAAVALAGLCLLTAAPAQATPPDAQNAFSVGTTNAGTTTSWVIVPANSINGGAPVVTSVDAATDAPNNAALITYLVIEQAQATAANTTVSIPIVSTNTGTKWDSGTIIIRHVASETYEKRALATSGGQTNLEVSAAPLTAVASGDMIYKVATNGAPFLQFETNTIAANRMWIRRFNGGPIIVGQRGKPLMIEAIAGGNNAAVYSAAGYYQP